MTGEAGSGAAEIQRDDMVLPMFPKDKLCPHCRAPVKSPLWSESEQNWIHFVWKCAQCDNQFKTTAIYDLLQLAWVEQPAQVTASSTS
jgi:hypothetical protein